jgi:hypothetical protein
VFFVGKRNQCKDTVTNMTIARQRYCKNRLKAGIVEPERTSIAEQRFGNHILEVTQAAMGPPLLDSKSPNTDSHDSRQIDN